VSYISDDLFSTTKMAAGEIDNVVTTKLLTLLDASAKIRKRTRFRQLSGSSSQLGGKRVVVTNVGKIPRKPERGPMEAGKEGDKDDRYRRRKGSRKCDQHSILRLIDSVFIKGTKDTVVV
jgi:hypothetical protein